MALLEANGKDNHNILGALFETEGGRTYISVISDYYTKLTEYLAMPNIEAKTVTEIIAEEVIVRFGGRH